MGHKDRKKKGKGKYNCTRDMNLVKMILNLESNSTDDYKKPADVYETYINMQEMKYNNDFRDSLRNSKAYLNDRSFEPTALKSLNELKTNDANSFLVLPLSGIGHLWSTLIRKTDEGFSAIIVNKGSRFWHDPIEEFVFKADKVNNLSNCLSYANINSSPNIEDVYREFINKSDAAYNLKVRTSPQKTGNCFTKNIQAGIKLAQATRNLSQTDFRKLRTKEYTPYGTSNESNKTFKWESMTTEVAQRLFVEKIRERNPAISDRVETFLDIYSCNKHFGENIKTSKNPVKTLFETFDPENKTVNMGVNDRIKELLTKLTPNVFESHTEAIKNIVKSTKDTIFIEVVNDLDKYDDLGISLSRNSRFGDYIDANHDPIKSLLRVFDYSNKLKDLDSNERIKVLLDKLSPDAITKNQSAVREILMGVYGKDKMKTAYRSLVENAEEQSFLLKTQMKSTNKRLAEISKHFPLVVADVRESLSDSFMKELNTKMIEIKKPLETEFKKSTENKRSAMNISMGHKNTEVQMCM